MRTIQRLYTHSKISSYTCMDSQGELIAMASWGRRSLGLEFGQRGARKMRVVTISPVRPREMKKIDVRLRQGGISCCIIAVSPFYHLGFAHSSILGRAGGPYVPVSRWQLSATVCPFCCAGLIENSFSSWLPLAIRYLSETIKLSWTELKCIRFSLISLNSIQLKTIQLTSINFSTTWWEVSWVGTRLLLLGNSSSLFSSTLAAIK